MRKESCLIRNKRSIKSVFLKNRSKKKKIFFSKKKFFFCFNQQEFELSKFKKQNRIKNELRMFSSTIKFIQRNE
jgi:hypothetical protein